MDALEARPTPPTTAQVVDAVGPRLRWLRERRDVTLAALAAETGISVSTLSRLESGQRRPTLELLLPLARAYQVPLDDLVGAPQTTRASTSSRSSTAGAPATRAASHLKTHEGEHGRGAVGERVTSGRARLSSTTRTGRACGRSSGRIPPMNRETSRPAPWKTQVGVGYEWLYVPSSTEVG